MKRFNADTHHIADVFHTFFRGKRLLYGVQRRGNSRSGIVHFVGYHTDYFLIGFLLSFHHFIRKAFDQKERMLESTVDKGGMGASVNVRVIQADGYCLTSRQTGKFPG